jgi:N-acetylglucosamine-6-phosphate deacetylase
MSCNCESPKSASTSPQPNQFCKMVSATTFSTDTITKLTNCRLVKGDVLVHQDLWISSLTGKILCGQEVFYGELDRMVPDRVIDLANRIVSPGLIDVQLNGAFGTNFSVLPENLSTFPKALKKVNKSLIKTGVTSYLPTMTSHTRETYHKVSASSLRVVGEFSYNLVTTFPRTSKRSASGSRWCRILRGAL